MPRMAYKLRGPLVAVPVLLAAACSWNQYDNELVAWPLGLALFLVGWVLRIWAQRHLAYRLKIPMALTSCGPYACVRNPIYLGNILMALGAVAASETMWMLPVTLAWCVSVYVPAVRYEEQRLARQYGAAYGAYAEAVSRWVPHPSRRRSAPCLHGALGPAMRAELHVPLMLAPAALKLLHVLVASPAGRGLPLT